MRATLALTAALALAACNNDTPATGPDKDSGAVTVTGPVGQGKFTYGADAANQKLPLDLPVYPGGRVMRVIDGTPDGRNGGVVAMLTDDSAEQLAAFYKGEAEKRNMTIKVNETKVGNFASFTAKGTDGESIVLSARPGGPNGGTHVMLIIESK